jgi:hypothetical protein
MSKIRFLLFLCSGILINGCTLFPQPAHYETSTSPAYDPTTSARVRILSGNDSQAAAFRRNSACYKGAWEDDPDRVQVDDSFFAHYKYSSRSITIGMPPSPRPWMRVDGLRFKDMIREYIVTGGQPMVISMTITSTVGDLRWGGYSHTCAATPVAFVPVAGQDYDVFMEGNARICSIAVHQIDSHGLDEPVPYRLASKCPDDPSSSQPIPRNN